MLPPTCMQLGASSACEERSGRALDTTRVTSRARRAKAHLEQRVWAKRVQVLHAERDHDVLAAALHVHEHLIPHSRVHHFLHLQERGTEAWGARAGHTAPPAAGATALRAAAIAAPSTATAPRTAAGTGCAGAPRAGARRTQPQQHIARLELLACRPARNDLRGTATGDIGEGASASLEASQSMGAVVSARAQRT